LPRHGRDHGGRRRFLDGDHRSVTPIRYTVYAVQSSTLPAAATLFRRATSSEQHHRHRHDAPHTDSVFFGVHHSANNTDANTAIRPRGRLVIPTPDPPLHHLPARPDHGRALKQRPGRRHTDCDRCHGDATRSVTDNYTTYGPAGLHNNGAPDLYFGRIPGETNAAWSGLAPPNDTCSNVDCHYNVTTPSWANGTTNCSTCHSYPPTTGVNHIGALTAPLDNTGFLKAHDDCIVCHGKKNGGSSPGYAQSMHGDGQIQMNSDVGYNGTNVGCANACHADDANHRMTASTRADAAAALGKNGITLSVTCNYCHNPGGASFYNAPAVPTTTATHPDPDGGGSTWSQGMCMGCHSGHIGAPSAVTVPLPSSNWTNSAGQSHVTGNMQTVLGINYTTHNGILLGGNGTVASISSKTTEAETCWGCHDALSTPVSEFGFNTNTLTAGYPIVADTSFITNGDTKGTGQGGFNYGWLFTDRAFTTKTSNWVSGGTGATPPAEIPVRLGAHDAGGFGPRRAWTAWGSRRAWRTTSTPPPET
jgi:predicted CxxxxCH...CXXCH cytochrome family protein